MQCVCHREASAIGGPDPPHPEAVALWRWGKGKKLLNISNKFSTFVTVRMTGHIMARLVAEHTEKLQQEIRKLVRHSDQCISLGGDNV